MIRDGIVSRGCAVQDGTVDLSWMLRSTWHGPEQERDPTRWRSEEAKAIVAAVRWQGQVERTSSGHLKVIGPAGSAVVASALCRPEG
jgi:hypothetical protein